MVLVMEPRALHMLTVYPITELHPKPSLFTVSVASLKHSTFNFDGVQFFPFVNYSFGVCHK
jgi:hypothetical protein